MLSIFVPFNTDLIQKEIPKRYRYILLKYPDWQCNSCSQSLQVDSWVALNYAIAIIIPVIP